MIHLKRINAVALAVKDINRSTEWYKEHFGFEKKYEVSNGIVIGDESIELVLSPIANPRNVRKSNEAKDVCIRSLAFEVSEDDLDRVQDEFPEEKRAVRIENPHYKSCKITDPDGHVLEFYVDVNKS